MTAAGHEAASAPPEAPSGLPSHRLVNRAITMSLVVWSVNAQADPVEQLNMYSVREVLKNSGLPVSLV